MHKSPDYQTKNANRRRLALAAACFAGLALPVANVAAEAPQCGCSDGCEGGHGPIYKALDTVAGGIEKLLFLGTKQRSKCDELGCDDGCDALSMSEMMMYDEVSAPTQLAPPVRMNPMPSRPQVQQPIHSQPIHGQPTPAHSLPMQSAPSESVPSHTMTAPPMLQRSEPTLQPPPASTPAPTRVSKPQGNLVPVPMPVSEPESEATGSGILPQDRSEDDSLFDSLQDPFRDDSALLNAPRNKRQEPTKAMPASYKTSTRRVIKSR